MIEEVKPNPGRGNKPQIPITAEEDKHRADGGYLLFSLHVEMKWAYKVNRGSLLRNDFLLYLPRVFIH